MALFTVDLPMLAELMADCKCFFDGKVTASFKRTMAYNFTSGQYKVHAAGVFRFCQEASSQLMGSGTVTVTRHDESWIYHGEWRDGQVEVQSFDSTLCAVSGRTLTYHQGSEDLSFTLCRAGPESQLPKLEDGYLHLEASAVEFPVLPGQELRFCAIDGEYVQLNVQKDFYSTDVYTEIWGVKIYRLTRSFGVVDERGQLAQGWLDFSHKKQAISWRVNNLNFETKSDLSGAEKKEKLLAWLTGRRDGIMPYQRNLLRALGLTVPYMVGSNGLKAGSAEAIAAS